ncbi:hypothetical protein DB32_004648 [Sandaracinus amylolyticus]|uniref:VWFA domain-containing protein n=1 Tax=Sandaracinus amylolyticus TaxID=927083 RepID=A0A0F6SFT4_9BACT|nr:hypothetical protein DB32_004648 [Sandaracinus amylolyticus]
MPYGRVAALLALTLPFVLPACTERAEGFDASGLLVDASVDGAADAGGFDAGPDDASTPTDAPIDAPIVLDPDAGCAMGSSLVEVTRRPVDIIWVVDNSTSMEPAIRQVQEGINDFVDLITDRELDDYRVIMLSLRGRGLSGSRYRVCIPPPLSGDSDCGDGERFFQVEVDIRSTQPIEQILGTLGQSTGYTDGSGVGSAPWRHLLREDATKTIVVVTDDNARTCARPHQMDAECIAGRPPLTETSLEDYPGGLHPFGGGTSGAPRALGPGLLTATYGTLFEGYTFNAIYGYGSETDPDVACRFSATDEASPGWTYTTLVQRTGGVRAKICDGAPAWGPFLDRVASTVAETSRIECEVAMPEPPEGTVLDPRRVNVQIRGASGSTTIPYAGAAASCDPTRGGWHYDDAASPTRVILCPSSCEFAREETAETSGGLDVIFGCQSIPI